MTEANESCGDQSKKARRRRLPKVRSGVFAATFCKLCDDFSQVGESDSIMAREVGEMHRDNPALVQDMMVAFRLLKAASDQVTAEDVVFASTLLVVTLYRTFCAQFDIEYLEREIGDRLGD